MDVTDLALDETTNFNIPEQAPEPPSLSLVDPNAKPGVKVKAGQFFGGRPTESNSLILNSNLATEMATDETKEPISTEDAQETIPPTMETLISKEPIMVQPLAAAPLLNEDPLPTSEYTLVIEDTLISEAVIPETDPAIVVEPSIEAKTPIPEPSSPFLQETLISYKLTPDSSIAEQTISAEQHFVANTETLIPEPAVLAPEASSLPTWEQVFLEAERKNKNVQLV